MCDKLKRQDPASPEKQEQAERQQQFSEPLENKAHGEMTEVRECPEPQLSRTASAGHSNVFKHWESLGWGVDFPFLDCTEPKDLGKRRIFFSSFSEYCVLCGRGLPSKETTFIRALSTQGKPIRYLQTISVLCLTKEKRKKLKRILKVSG